jgi:hypothetical protein
MGERVIPTYTGSRVQEDGQNILNEIKVDIRRSSHLKLLSQIKGNSVNKFDYFRVNFCCGRPLGLLTPGNKNRSYATERCC